MKNIQHEITPINEDDLFIILNHPKADFDYPIHFHSDFELNLVLWDFGRRIVGDSIEPFEEVDLVLTGPNDHTNGKATMSRATMSSLYNFTNSS